MTATHDATLERLGRDELEALQWQRFTDQLAFLYERNPFYRARLTAAGVTPASVGTRDDLRRIPTIAKDDLLADQVDHPPYGRRLGVPPTDVARITMSGGTSGKGREIHPLTRDDLGYMATMAARAYRWAGMEDGDSVAFNVGVSNHNGGWTFLLGAEAVGRAPYLIGHESFATRLELMSTFGADGMWGTPSAVNGLAVAAAKLGRTPRELVPDLKFVLLGAEAYPVEYAMRVADEWGAQVREIYGSTATLGVAAATCERGVLNGSSRGGMHLFEGEFLFEVVDPGSGAHVAPGESGELVLTTLARQASPMLRLSTRDRVTFLPHHACACGRPFHMLETGTIGRLDDMMKIKNVNIWPSQIDEIIFSNAFVDEYQGEIVIGDKGRDEARVAIAFSDSAATWSTAERQEVLDLLQRALREQLEVTFDLRPVPRSELPTFDSGERKARRWTDRRAAGLR